MSEGMIQILLVEDNPTDVMLMRETLDRAGMPHALHVVRDGIEAMEFLHHEGGYAAAPRPNLIFLDLNMPRKGGQEVLVEVKANEQLRSIPVIILTSSKAELEVLRAYGHDASFYIQKSADFKAFGEVIRSIHHVLAIDDHPAARLNPMGDETIPVLLVDDGPTDALIVREELMQVAGVNFEITHVERLAEAVQQLGKKDFAVVLLDLSLPDSDGFETFIRLREASPDIPVVILSGRVNELLAVQAVQAGAQDYLVKGHMQEQVLARAIRYAIKRASSEKDLREQSRLLEKQNTGLRESEERWETVTEAMSEGLILSDTKGQLLRWNRAALEMHGFSKETDLRLKLPEFATAFELSTLAGEILPMEQWPLQRVLRNESLRNIEFRLHRIGSDWQRILSYSGALVREPSGQQIAFLTVSDVTERKRAEDQIAEQASFLDKAQDAIVVRDLKGEISFWNKGAERMYGWLREEVLGRNMDKLLYANAQKFEEINSLMISKGEWAGDVIHLTKDQREIIVEARMTLIRNRKGKPKSVLAIKTDITEKKKTEAQFLRAQRMESIGTLASGIAHDLNNILAPIMMSIGILKTSSDTPQTSKILQTIETSAKRGADIVRQVLSFARGVEGERLEIQLNHLLKDLEDIIADTFPKDIRLQFSHPNDTWTILGDPTQIHQVLLNLCVNARDAMSNGGVLTIGVENCVLDEQYVAMHAHAKAGRYVKISVIDSGIGIPPKLIDKIFEPFFTTKELHKGTGLGLSTVMAIVKSHEGIVNVYSEQGKGTTFTVHFLAAELSSVVRSSDTGPIGLPVGNGELILVVDDEASILTITSQTLETYGYRVLTATDGADAVATYLQHRDEIAVVLTDMMMPVMDGQATIHALTRINPMIKIIAASGLSANGHTAKTSSSHIKHFLTKPYTAGTLCKTMRMILDES
jgi:two-component system cell cycle sensor histidine kinase/response regulator CckA